MQTTGRNWSRARRAASWSVVVLLVVEAVLLRHYLTVSAAAAVRAQLWWLGVAAVAEFVSMNAFGRLQQRMVRAAGARVSAIRMIALSYATNAITATLPGGTALSAGYLIQRLRPLGVSVGATGFAVVSSGLLSTVTFGGLVIVCAVIAPGGGSGWLVTLPCAAVAVALFVLVRRRRARGRRAARGATILDRLVRRLPDRLADPARRLLGELAAVRPRRRDWLVGAGFAGLNWLADFGCLLATCRAVGVDHTTPAVLLTAYVAGMTASGVSFLPGGFGVIDVAMVAVLSGNGAGSTTATAAVLLYRGISCVLVVTLGWLVWARERVVRGRSCAASTPIARLGAQARPAVVE